MEDMKTYDFIVIGAGSGGMGAGRRASLLGKKVAMIENRVIGGTCVNVGCVPKKVMFNLANFLEEAHVMQDYGVNGTEGLKLDFKTFKQRRDAYVKRLNGIYETNIAKADVDYFKGTAKFESNKVVSVSTGAKLTADHIMIASGSYPETPNFEGSEHCINSDHIFEMEELPEKMVVIGGGYIGIEIAQIMQAFGVKVTLLVRDIPLRFVDKDVVDELVVNMKKLGMDVRLKTPFTKVTKGDNGMLSVHLNDGTTVEGEKCLIALGRPPNVEPLALENTDVKVEKRAVVVDEFQNTTAPGIYAIGDVTNQATLTPVAIRAGRIVSERIFNNRPGLKMSYDNIATVIFSHPPIGTVGMGEQEAKKKFGDDKVKAYRSKFTNMFYSPAQSDDKKQSSLFKLICHIQDDGQEKVVGLHGLGKGIDEMMQGCSVAITMGATK